MFLGKYNSDNSYYLYEQIKALFYQAMDTVVFIESCAGGGDSPGGLGGAAPNTCTSTPLMSVPLCRPHGKAQNLLLEPAGRMLEDKFSPLQLVLRNLSSPSFFPKVVRLWW